jgi:putative DNA primase/helicase
MTARPLTDLADALQAFGLVLPRGGIIADGKFQRVTDERHHKKRNTDGWYNARILPGGLVVAAFGSWIDGRSTKWNSRGEAVARLSSADREAVADQRRKVEAERAARARKVEREAARIWGAATPCSSHPYLTAKAVKSYGLRSAANGDLLIPVFDMSGNLRSWQPIKADGTKLWPYGTDRSTALQFTIGDLKAGVAVIVVVEGYATGATIHEATGLPVVVAFDAAGLKRIAALLRVAFPDAVLIFAGDNDASGTGQKAARDAAAEVGGLAFCPPVTGADWNDHTHGKRDKNTGAIVCKPHGLDDVRDRFRALLSPHQVEPGLLIDHARARLRVLMQEGVEALMAADWSSDGDLPPPVALLAASLGLGKTAEAIDIALALIGRGVGPVVIAAPDHELNRQLRDRTRAAAAAIGNPARIEMRLGREANNPDGPGKMCLDLEAVRDVIAAGLDAQSTVCERRVEVGQDDNGRPIYEVRRCPFFDACPFQAQAAKSADLWLVSHAALGHTKPGNIGRPALLFVDENPVGAMLRGTGALPVEWITVGLGDVAPYVTTPAGGIDKVRSAAFEADNPELIAVRRSLDAVRRLNGLGDVRREALGDLSAEALRCAAGQAKNLIRRPVIVPGMAPAQRRELLKDAAGNRARLREAKLYGLLADFLDRPDQATASGHVSLATYKDTRGNRHEVWRLTYLAPINKGWHAPTVMLDATARDDYRPILRHLFPGLRDDLGGKVKASTPHLRVTVVTGRSMSLQATGAARYHRRKIDQEGATAEPPALLTRRAREEAARVLKLSRDLGGVTGLVTGNKTMVEALRTYLPDTIGEAHFNALRGRDDWRNARFAVTLGRPMPSPRDVEVMAGAILGRAVEPAGDWYERTTRPLFIKGKIAATVEGVRHPDPVAEALRWSICEAEVLQAGGRLRPADRTADTPADWYLVGCPIPDELTVHAVEPWQAPTPADEMLAAGGVALLSAPAAFRAYPTLWPSVEAAKKALQRAAEQTGTFPYRDSHKGMSPSGLTAIRYRLAGERQRPAMACVDPSRVPDPAAWLVDHVGPLAHFEVMTGPKAPPPADALPVPVKTAPATLPAAIPAEPGGQFLQSIKGGDLAANSEVSATLKATASFAKVDASSEWPTPSLPPEASAPADFLSSTRARGGFAEISGVSATPPPPMPSPFAMMPPAEFLESIKDDSAKFSGTVKGGSPDPWGDYDGGIMPDHVRHQVRDRWRAAAGMTQDDLARRVGISRPQLANALQGRFGLSPDAAARLRAAVAALPVTQAAFL